MSRTTSAKSGSASVLLCVPSEISLVADIVLALNEPEEGAVGGAGAEVVIALKEPGEGAGEGAGTAVGLRLCTATLRTSRPI